MSFIERLNKKKTESINNNIDNILNQPNLITKIENNYEIVKYIYNTELTLEEYKKQTIEEIKNKQINTVLHYMVNTTRQNIYEPIQLNMLSERLNMSFIRYSNENNLGKQQTKTYDGINYENKIIVQCKYIYQNGGAQDNQFNDLVKFNQEYDNGYRNIMIISGEYGIKKMNKYLIDNYLHKNNFVVLLKNDTTSDKIVLISENIRKQVINKHFNKYYSCNQILLYNMNINEYIKNKIIIEPFYGEGDLLKIYKENIKHNQIKTYDIIIPKNKQYEFEQMDTLLNCVWKNQTNIFIITNPPWSAINKITNNEYKQIMKQYNLHDLYQIFINHLIIYPVYGGVIVLPVNFIFGYQSRELFNKFSSIYDINVLNIFENKVFEHTTQATVSLLFTNTSIYQKHETKIYLHRKNNIITISYNLFNEIITFDFNTVYNNKYIDKIKRNVNISNDFFVSNIKISTLDYNMKAYLDNYDNNTTCDKLTDRAFMRLCFHKSLKENINKITELVIINEFNNRIIYLKQYYYGLVFTSYREFDRKRITFEQVFILISDVLSKYINN